MATRKQLHANRLNAQKSTGPRTPEGRARSARNALTHGLASDALAVLRIEHEDQIDALKAAAVEAYQPVNDEEMFAVERIALCKLSIIRAARLEAGLFSTMLDLSLNDNNITPFTPLDPRLTADIELHKDQNRNFALATGLQRLIRQNDSFPLFLRYQAHAERLYRRAVEAFDDLRARRDTLSPNEPNFAEPESPQPLADTPAPLDTPAPPAPVEGPAARPSHRRPAAGARTPAPCRKLGTMTRLLAALAFCLPLTAQQPTTIESKLAPKIDAALKKSGAPSVSVAVVEDGKLAYAHAIGYADLAANREASAATRYAIGSVSKEFIAAAILMLCEQGKMSLDDKVAKYYPNLRRASDITVRQLLTHTSGYEDYAPQDYIIPEWTEPITPAAIIDRWANKPLNYEPGTKWQYSNTGYVLAGSIFEKASGEGLVAFLKTHVFQPLGMTTADDWKIGDPANATAYTRFAAGPPRPVKREAPHWYFAAGELAMTPSDLAKWDIALLEHKLLSAKSYEEFTREAILANGNRTHYALGLSVGELSNIPMYSHSGEVSGFLASNAIFPTRNAAVIVLSNQDGVNLVGSLARQLASTLLLPDAPEGKPKDTAQVRRTLETLRAGRIDRAQFTSNANAYFTAEALADIKTSLAKFGKLKSVVFASENLRGGMIHRGYRAEFEKQSVSLNLYLTQDGKYEQFMIEQ